MELRDKVNALAGNFLQCKEILNAIGDETRQYMVLEMMQTGNCTGVRVGDIVAESNLSRTSVSHHLQVLKNAGIVKVRKEGTKNYYYFEPDAEKLAVLAECLRLVEEIIGALPDRSGEDE